MKKFGLLGLMTNPLCGHAESVHTLRTAIGKTITGVTLGPDDEALHVVFTDGSKIKLFDDGQSSCESRYMRTDDMLTEYVGSQLLGADIKEGPEEKDENGEIHEV